jgi:hypothetical protein
MSRDEYTAFGESFPEKKKLASKPDGWKTWKLKSEEAGADQRLSLNQRKALQG